MPVEILEIVVRANVQEPGATVATAANTGQESDFQQQQLIEEAVEQMLEVLRRREER